MSEKTQIVITGASSGFGWEMATRFLEMGFTVHGTSRSGQISAVDTLSSDTRKRFHIYALDLNSPTSRVQFLGDLKKQVKKIDVLINNAGFGLFGALEDLSEEQIRTQMEVNFFGTVLITRGLLPLLRQAHGHIINMSSILGHSALPLTSLYCASKFALEGWSESLKFELEPHDVRVTVVQPGAHRTRFGFNVKWGEASQSESSPYILQSRNYQRLLEKMRTRPNPAQPASVADSICRLVKSPHPPFRVTLGRDARMASTMRKVLPFRLFMNMSGRVYRRLFLQPAQP